MRFSYLQFFKWALTPKIYNVWPAVDTASLNILVSKSPFLDWYDERLLSVVFIHVQKYFLLQLLILHKVYSSGE